ncbi:MAG: hypothetical protein R3230_00055 [Nitrosopumilaceae archaeon]|nr:hypothetical protein [Nitrosopumilaceae archaeon]
MSEFNKFNDAVNKQFKWMQNHELFVIDADKNFLWDVYLRSFREGDNPMYKERTEHDCNCCKQFIRDVGGVVAIVKGKIHTIWDVDVGGVYQPVADGLRAAVLNCDIANVYRHYQAKIGTQKSYQNVGDDDIITWEHFYTKLPNKYVSGCIGQVKGGHRTNYDVLKRSVEEISLDAIETVSDLISQNSIYRGQEFKNTVSNFKRIKKAYDKAKKKELFLWEKSAELKEGGRYRNTVIGTLLTDISDGVPLEDAVKMYETKVAPENYKRTTALITQGMIKKAQKDVEKLGIEDSLYRRYAVENDLTINNVLFADRSTKTKMKGVFDGLITSETKKTPKNIKKVDEISIGDFIENVLPKAESLEVFVDNKHTSNFVSLVAPVDENAPNILKWDNNFSWSYVGEVTDSIKERVKSAGGQVEADVRASLAWSNYDDLDIHVIEPDGNEIYYGNRTGGISGGELDVDMNAGARRSRTPVENIFWKDQRRMQPGIYTVFVDQYSKREKSDVGFEVQFAYNGGSETFFYPKDVKSNENIKVLDFKYTKNGDIEIVKRYIDSEAKSHEMWGVNTQNFQKVKMVMLSPNHWDDQEVGNKHYFFMLEECVNPDEARGFYNEFLRSDLTKHRKVFEVLSAKMKTQESDNQLSGLGFSSTKRNDLLVKVSGSFNRTLKVKF